MCNCNRESDTFTSDYGFNRDSDTFNSSCNCNRDSENYRRNREQHVHEFLGSTIVRERCEDCHSHRFATVSDEAIRSGDSHVHKIKFRTDSIDGHYHEFCGTSSRAIWVGDGRHVHFVKACTDVADGHTHAFRAASLIDDPTEDDECS